MTPIYTVSKEIVQNVHHPHVAFVQKGGSADPLFLAYVLQREW